MTQTISIFDLTFTTPNDITLFDDLSLSFSQGQTGLVGRNGIGKSTLLKLMTGELQATAGSINIRGTVAYCPQNFLCDNKQTIANVLGIQDKLIALDRITAGSTDISDFEKLGDDWDIREHTLVQLANFNLGQFDLDTSFNSMSGGERTRLLLCKTVLSDADFIILDEPTNNLDTTARQQLYNIIQQSTSSFIIVSHDRELLNMMDCIVELNSKGLKTYGGNYDHYKTQKQLEVDAAKLELHSSQELLSKAKRVIQERREKYEKAQARGKRAKLGEIKARGSYNKIGLKAEKERSEKTNKKIRTQANRKSSELEERLKQAKAQIEISHTLDIDLAKTKVPNGKVVLDIENLTFQYPDTDQAIIQDFHLKIQGPERIAIVGDNGSGKSTLVKLILARHCEKQGDAAIQPQNSVATRPLSNTGLLRFARNDETGTARNDETGTARNDEMGAARNDEMGAARNDEINISRINIGVEHISYLDQHASTLIPGLSVIENFQNYNPDIKPTDAYRTLAHFLFRNTAAEKSVDVLSGSERLRAALACTLMSSTPPQLLILDEPTNHLDLESIESLESALNAYQGALMVISHDQQFLKNIGTTKTINM